MKTATISDFRDNLKKYLDDVDKNSEILLLSRPKKQGMVVLSLSHFESLRETAYLLSTKTNTVRLMDGIEQARSKKLIKKTIKEL
jgi:antitoxin YefM